MSRNDTDRIGTWAVISLAFLCGCHGAPLVGRDLAASEQGLNPQSILSCFRVTPIGFAGPVVRSTGGWGGELPTPIDAVNFSKPGLTNSPSTWQAQLLIAIVGPPSGVVGLARDVRRESNFQKLVDVVDASSQRLLTFDEGGGVYLRDFAGVFVEVDAPHTHWDAKQLADGVALSIASVRVDFVVAPRFDCPYLVTLEPLQRALASTWEGIPVDVDVRPVELMLREP